MATDKGAFEQEPQRQHHWDFIRHVISEMATDNFEPTLEDFLDWVRTTKDLTEDRRTLLLEQQVQGKTLDELWCLLSNSEEFEWYREIDLLIFERFRL